MSIVKDLLLILIFLAIITKYIFLQRKIIKQQKYFIDTLSHDLRISTIAQIRGLDLLQKNHPQIELVQEINESCKFSLDMINTLLNSYKFENKEDFLNYETFNISELLKTGSKHLRDFATSKNIKFCFKLENILLIEAEKHSILKVITTLISTAIINSYNNGSLYITATKSSKSIKVTLIYNGKSLSEEECKRMFLENPRFSTVGEGIKLHLAKKIIDSHKGKIFVKTLEKDLNSFTFILPLKKNSYTIKSHIISGLQPYILQ